MHPNKQKERRTCDQQNRVNLRLESSHVNAGSGRRKAETRVCEKYGHGGAADE